MSDLTKLQSAEPVLITDGSNMAVCMNNQPTGTEYGLVVRPASIVPIIFPNTSTFAISTINTDVSASTNTVISGAYLWHPASVLTTYYIQRIVVTTDSSGGTTKASIKITRITAEHSNPGGSLITPISFDSSLTSNAVVRSYATNSPTRISGDAFTRTFVGNTASTNIFDFPIDITTPVCRAGIAEGWEIRFDVTTPALNNLRATIEIIWTEV